MSIDLQVLAKSENRNALLLAEVAAWLHMLGKFHEDFLKGNHALAIQIPEDLTRDFPGLDRLLRDNWVGRIWDQMGISEFSADTLSLHSLAEKHHDPNAPTGLQRLMQDAHGRGSGIEKGVLERFALGQTTTVHSATAVGNESSQAIDLTTLQSEREKLYVFLETQLQNLRDANASVNWTTFRSAFIRQVERTFRASVAETRRPLNDVTLFDQTAASVVLFKAALAQNLLLGWKDPKQTKVADKYHWRVLRVGLDGLQFWGQAVRVNDLLSRKALVEPALDQVKRLIEEIYPLGAEVYRDENGSLFVVPNIADLLDAQTESGSLRACLQQIAKDVLASEATFVPALSERTRNMLSFGHLATAELPSPSPQPEWVQANWNGDAQHDICPVCGLRPQGPSEKGLERKVCDICEERRGERAKQWASNLAATIWTDEVADTNGRLALVVGQFGLEAWLTGEAFSSMTAFDPSSRLLTDEKRNNKQYQFDYQSLLIEIGEALSPRKVKQTFGKWVPLLDALVLDEARGDFDKFIDIYNLYVSDTDLNRGMQEAHLFALALMRQQPAPARLRRVWETTRTFWESALSESVLRTVSPRLVIQPTNADQLDLGPYHTYDLVLGPTKLSVLYRNGNFIAVDNLCYAAKQLGAERDDYSNNLRAAQFVRRWLETYEPFDIEEPTGYGSPNKLRGRLEIQSVQPEGTPYTPAIPILAEPRTFMALVPAKNALAVVKAIKAKYEREMGKVRNRLPLTLGAVYFGRRTPLAAALDTGRRMLKRQVNSGRWTVNSSQSRSKSDAPAHLQRSAHFQTWQQVKLKNDVREITLGVSTVMGDGTTEDKWYPYWHVVAWSAGNAPEKRSRWFKGTSGEYWVHVNELKEGDTVQFTPSTFDFEFLDTTARRFEVSYDKESGQRRGADRRQRPYLLEELDDLEETWKEISRLSKSQMYMLESLIEGKRKMWDKPRGALALALDKNDVFGYFVCDTLKEAKSYNPHLERAALSGMLSDALELHLTIAKEKEE